MPYICGSQRAKLDGLIEEINNAIAAEAVDGGDETSFAGMTNYVCTRILLGTNQRLFTKTRYWNLALITGIIENVKQEFYRRYAAEFENEKIKLNGDVPEYEEVTA